MSSQPHSVDILVATYNGARFLGPQIESLLMQKGVSFRILVRDDGSTDETPELIRRYLRLRPDCIVPIDGSENLGAVATFARLLSQAKAPYAALCDQDDVWEPCKLESSLKVMREMEDRHGVGTPLLVHSDLKVVDESLRLQHPSFWRYSGFDPRNAGLARLLIKNTVTGCASLVNRALIRLALPIPQAALVHDYWLALVAAATGQIGAVAEPLVAYRQHRHNLIGARAYDWKAIAGRLSQGLTWDIGALRRQAAALSERCRTLLTPENQALIDDFIGLPELTWIGRRRLLLRRGILMPGLMRNLALFFCVRLGR
ncbi:MAG TPA: glycosyltransferase family 2 protein [Burkholderiales bacterium]